MKDEKNIKSTAADAAATDSYPGVAINRADNDKVTNCLVKEDVKQLNNNPRNHKS